MQVSLLVLLSLIFTGEALFLWQLNKFLAKTIENQNKIIESLLAGLLDRDSP